MNMQMVNEKEWLSEDEYREKAIYNKVDKNINYLKQIMGDSFDLVTRELEIDNKFQKLKFGIAYMDGITNSDFINKIIIGTIENNYIKLNSKKSQKEIINYFEKSLLTISEVRKLELYGDLINHLLNGDTILFLDEEESYFAIGSKAIKERAIDKPDTDISIKGSKEAFTDNLATNVSLLRRRMRNPNLWVKRYVIGKKTNCNIALVYIKGIAKQTLIDEFERRLNSVEIQNILDSSYLKYYLKEKQKTIFPLIYDSERPDIVMGNLYVGKIAVIVDGTAFTLIFPTIFLNFIHTAEDYYHKSSIATYYRIIRYIALISSIFLPAFYLCVVSFHSEILPTNLAYTIAGQREVVPLPAVAEILLVLFAFDLLTEAGTRMPKMVGSALSFVGAIIIGQSAVEADLISSMMLIIVAINGIGNLLIPDYEMQLTLRLVRYLLIFVAAMYGLFGFTIASIILVTHLVSLRSFGIPYMSPISPLNSKGLLDTLYRAPIGKLFKRKKEVK